MGCFLLSGRRKWRKSCVKKFRETLTYFLYARAFANICLVFAPFATPRHFPELKLFKASSPPYAEHLAGILQLNRGICATSSPSRKNPPCSHGARDAQTLPPPRVVPAPRRSHIFICSRLREIFCLVFAPFATPGHFPELQLFKASSPPHTAGMTMCRECELINMYGSRRNLY